MLHTPSRYPTKMADGTKVNTKFTLSPVKSHLNVRIQSVPSKKDKELIFVSNGGRFVYLFENNRLLNTYSFACHVTYFVVHGRDIFAVTEDGKVWKVPFSRHKVKTAPKANNQDPTSTSPVNHSIFSDLLSNNDINQPITPSVHVTEISTTHAILYEPNIQTILFIDGFLIATSLSGEDIAVSFYEDNLSNISVPTHRFFLKQAISNSLHASFPMPLICHKEESDGTTNVLQRGLFEFLKPVESDSGVLMLLGSPDGKIWSIDMDTNNVINGNAINNTTIDLTNNTTREETNNTTIDLTNNTTIDNVTNNTTNNALNETKKISNVKTIDLTNNTTMDAANIKTIDLTNNTTMEAANNTINNATKTINNAENNTVNIPTNNGSTQSNFQLVWHLEEPVVSMSLSSLSIDNNNTPNNINNAVIMVGQKGKCVIMYRYSNTCEHSELNLSGPVVCCTAQNSCLLYSTGREICVAKLSLINSVKSSQIVMATSYFPIAYVVAMCPLKASSNTDDMIRLAGLTLDGVVVEVTLSLDESKASLSSQQQGHQLKELLTSIEEIALQTESLEQDLDTVDKVLRQLNQDASFIIKLTSSPSTSHLIKWTVQPCFSPSNGSYYLAIKINNLSKSVLTSCWSVLIQISGIPAWNGLASTMSISRSVNIQNLAHGVTTEFSVQIPERYNLVNCLSIEAFLCYNLRQVAAKLPDKMMEGLSGVMVSLGKTNVDVLHFAAVQSNIDGCGFRMEVLPSHLDELESFCQVTNQSNSDSTKATDHEERPQTIKIPITEAMFSCITKLSQANSSPHILMTQDLQALSYIIQHSDGILEVPQEVNKVGIDGKSTEKRLLRIQVERGGRVVGEGVNVVLQAPSKMELYLLVEAFTHRLKSIISYLSSTSQLSDKDLQDTLRTIEELHSELMPFESV